MRLPDYVAGSRSHSWWGVVVLLLVDGAIFASLAFSFFYLLDDPGQLPNGSGIPNLRSSLLSAAALIGSAIAMWVATRSLGRDALQQYFPVALLMALVLMSTSISFHFDALSQLGVRPEKHAYGATMYAIFSWQTLHCVLLVLMSGFTLARWWSGKLNRVRRVVFDNTRLIWLYAVSQGIIALTFSHALRLD
jgi:cytochrome c oxidase subunit I+III